MADLSTLQTWLMEAELALHKLRTGAREIQIEHGDMRVTYTEQKAGELDSYIADLKAQIAGLGGTVTGLRRRGIEVDLPGNC
jgi:hypothetical protein